ncbi:hypothetical protein JCM18899A_31820 [Nocardioides sp. AN3]
MVESPEWVSLVAAVAQQFHHEPEAQSVVRAAAHLAVHHAPGSDAAAISLIRREERVETIACTDVVGAIGDLLQFALGEGPSLDAAWDERIVESGDVGHDRRWPAWGTRMSRDHDAASVLCLPLFVHDDHVGALILYSRTPHGLDLLGRDGVLALAARLAMTADRPAPLRRAVAPGPGVAASGRAS